MGPANNWGLPVEDLGRVLTSCPALHTLDIRHLLAHPPCVDFTPLLQFTACQRLCVGGQEFDDRAAPAVAQLTQLTYLGWDCSRDYDNLTCLTRVGLAKLTALTGLQELHLTEQPNEVDMTIVAKPVGFSEVARYGTEGASGPHRFRAGKLHSLCCSAQFSNRCPCEPSPGQWDP